MIRTYSELIQIPTFEERFKYLQLNGKIGEDTFGFDRYMNQELYHSDEWYGIRDYVIIRDEGCDLAHPDYTIHGRILIHHMNPITKHDILNRTRFLLDPDYLITTTFTTHNAIHYGDYSLIPKLNPERKPNDTCPWR